MLTMLQLKKIGWKILDEIYPPSCIECKTAEERWCIDCQSTVHTLSEHSICPVCGIPQSLPVICEECSVNPPDFEAARSWGYYEGGLRQAIHSLKYHRNLGIAEVLASRMVETIRTLNWKFDIIIPVPIGRKRLIERDYNQAAKLAQWISWTTCVKATEKALIRIKETKSQVGLNASQRRENLNGAFYAEGSLVAQKTILLVDDVITTSATVRACSKALINAGATKVFAISAARAGNYHLN